MQRQAKGKGLFIAKIKSKVKWMAASAPSCIKPLIRKPRPKLLYNVLKMCENLIMHLGAKPWTTLGADDR